MDDIGKKIKQRRDDLGLTLEEVGQAVGVGKSTVRKWETGDIKNMKRDKISKLAYVLKVSPSFIMGEDPDAAPTRDSVATKLEAVLRQAGYLLPGEQLTPELLSSISVALETAIEIYRKNHK